MGPAGSKEEARLGRRYRLAIWYYSPTISNRYVILAINISRQTWAFPTGDEPRSWIVLPKSLHCGYLARDGY